MADVLFGILLIGRRVRADSAVDPECGERAAGIMALSESVAVEFFSRGSQSSCTGQNSAA